MESDQKNFIILTETNFSKLKEQIKKNLGKKIIFTSNNDELNQKVLEKLQIKILLINQKGRKDFQKQRNSGFNQVLAKLAKKNNVKVGINLDEIIGSEKKEKSEIIARIRQNVRICNKNKIEMEFVSLNKKRNFYDLKSFGSLLGMPTWMMKKV